MTDVRCSCGRDRRASSGPLPRRHRIAADEGSARRMGERSDPQQARDRRAHVSPASRVRSPHRPGTPDDDGNRHDRRLRSAVATFVEMPVIGRDDERLATRIDRPGDATDRGIGAGDGNAILRGCRAGPVPCPVHVPDMHEDELRGRQVHVRVFDDRIVHPGCIGPAQAGIGVGREHRGPEARDLGAAEHRIERHLLGISVGQHPGGGGLDARCLSHEIRRAEGGELRPGRDVLALRTKSVEDGHLAGGIEPKAVDQHPHDARRGPVGLRRTRSAYVENSRPADVEGALVTPRRVSQAGGEDEGAEAGHRRVIDRCDRDGGQPIGRPRDVPSGATSRSLASCHACGGHSSRLPGRLAILRQPPASASMRSRRRFPRGRRLSASRASGPRAEYTSASPTGRVRGRRPPRCRSAAHPRGAAGRRRPPAADWCGRHGCRLRSARAR